MRRTLYLAAASVVLVQGSVAAANEGAAGPALVTMSDIVVPIVDGARAYGRMRVKLVLLAHDAKAVPALQARMPELREAAVIAAAEFARLYASPYAPVDAERLVRDLSAALAARDHEHAITRVLLVGVSANRS